jgi:hypothetical protein
MKTATITNAKRNGLTVIIYDGTRANRNIVTRLQVANRKAADNAIASYGITDVLDQVS